MRWAGKCAQYLISFRWQGHEKGLKIIARVRFIKSPWRNVDVWWDAPSPRMILSQKPSSRPSRTSIYYIAHLWAVHPSSGEVGVRPGFFSTHYRCWLENGPYMKVSTGSTYPASNVKQTMLWSAFQISDTTRPKLSLPCSSLADQDQRRFALNTNY